MANNNDINLNLHINNLEQLNVFERRALAASLAVSKLNAAGASSSGFTAIERDANFAFSQIARGAEGAGKVIKNAFGFSTSFLGFIVVNETLKTFGALTAGSVRAAAEFESGLAKVAKTTDLTKNQLSDLSNEFREISRSGPLTTQALLGAAEIAGQLGISGVDNIKRFSTTVSQLAVSTNLSVDAAATFLGRFQNITNLPSDKLENIASVVTGLGNRFASTESEIAEFSLRLAGAGNTLGIKSQEIVGFGNALASVGLNAEAGGTAFSRVFLKIFTASIQGGDALSKFSSVAGTTNEQFKAIVDNDPSQAVIKFVQGLGQIKNSGGDVISVLESLGLNEIRVRDALLRASTAQGLFKESIREANREFKINSALGIEFQRQSETTASSVQKLANNFKDMQITLGNAFLPALASSSEGLSNFLQGLSGSEQGSSKLGDNLNNVFGILHTGISGVTSMIDKIDSMANSFGVLSSSINVATQALAALAVLQLGSGFGQFGGAFIGEKLGISGGKAAANIGKAAIAEGLLKTQSIATPFGKTVVITRPGAVGSFGPDGGVNLPRITANNRFQDSVTGKFLSNEQALKQYQQIIPENSLQSFRGLASALETSNGNAGKLNGTLTALRLSAQNAGNAMKGFLSTGTGQFLAVAVAIGVLNEVLERTTGQGLLEVFSSADERANAYNDTQKKLNSTLEDFRSLVSSGKITPVAAGNDILKSSLIDINGLLIKQTELQDRLGKTRGFGAPTLAGVGAGAGSGAIAGGAAGAIFGFGGGAVPGAVIGGVVGGGLGLVGSSFASGKAQSAALKGQIEANREAIRTAASEFQITVADVEKIKIQFKDIGIDPEANAKFKKEFNTLISDVTQGQFAQQLKQLDFAAEAFKNKIGSKEITIPNLDNFAKPTKITAFGFDPKDATKFGDTVKLIFEGIALDQDNFNALVAEGVINFQDYPPVLLAFINSLNSVKEAQEAVLADIFKENPLIEGVQGAVASNISQLSASTSKDLIAGLKSGAEQGLTLRDTLKSIDVPTGIKETAVLFTTLVSNMDLTDEEITALIANFSQFGGISADVLKFLAIGFDESNKAAAEFANTIDGVKKFLGELPSFADALTLSPDTLTKGAKTSLDEFVAYANEQLTGIKTPDSIAQGIEGSKIQLESLGKFGEALNSVRDASLLKIKLIDPADADLLKTTIEGVTNAFANSDLGAEDRIQAVADVTKLTELYAELKSQGVITPEVKAFFDDQFLQLQNWINGKGDRPSLAVLVNFDIKTEALISALNKLANDIKISIPVTLNGRSVQVNAKTVTENLLSPGGRQLFPPPATQQKSPFDIGNPLGDIDQAQKQALDLYNANASVIGANNDALDASTDKLSKFEEDLLAIQRVLTKLGITAKDFVELNNILGLGADQISKLSDVLRAMGVDIGALLPLMEKVSFEKFAKQIGASDQAIKSGAAKQALEKLVPGISTDTELQKLLEPLIGSLGETPKKGLQEFQRLGAGGAIGGAGNGTGTGVYGTNLTPEEFIAYVKKQGLAHAAGGIVTKPTFGLMGEAGMEAIIPLDKMSSVFGSPKGSGGNYNSTNNMNAPITIIGAGDSANSIAQRTVNGMARMNAIINRRRSSVF